MPKDALMQNGDYILEDDGNYRKEATVFGRVYRSAMSYRDRWPAGRGKTIGNRFWQRLDEGLKKTEENLQLAVEDFEESQQDWIENGMLALGETTLDETINGRPVIVMETRDTGTRLVIKYPTELPWDY